MSMNHQQEKFHERNLISYNYSINVEIIELQNDSRCLRKGCTFDSFEVKFGRILKLKKRRKVDAKQNKKQNKK